MEEVADYLVARIQEPSTWVSLGTLFSGIGIVIAPEYWQAIMGAGMGIGGLLGVILRERKKTTPQEIKTAVEVLVKPEATKPVSLPVLEAAMKNGN